MSSSVRPSTSAEARLRATRETRLRSRSRSRTPPIIEPTPYQGFERDELPLAISFVSFGFKKAHGEMFQMKIDGMPNAAIYNCIDFIPSEKGLNLGPGATYKEPHVQQIVFSQEGITPLCNTVMSEMLRRREAALIGLGCNKGMHRSGCAGEMLASQMNAITVWHFGKFVRLFNVMHWNLNEAYTAGVADDWVNHAIQWVDDRPWMANEKPQLDQKTQLWAYEACSRSPGAIHHWEEIHKCAIEIANLPNQWNNPLWESFDDQNDNQVDDQLPGWATFNKDVHVWIDTLNECWVDEMAQKELFLLSQHSDRGWEEANSIIAKLLKKQTDNDLPRNSSAFVHRAVLNARHTMLDV